MNITDLIVELLEKGQKVVMPGIGTLDTVQRTAYHDPATHTYYPAGRAIAFSEASDEECDIVKVLAERECINEEVAKQMWLNYIDALTDKVKRSGRHTFGRLGTLTCDDKRTFGFKMTEGLVLDADSKLHDFRWLFAAYVNEEHPYIDSILNDIMQQGIVTKITGYQKDAKSVVSQVEAIWYYALERGIAYSSISCTSTPTKRANVQHIRFFDQVYNSRQANCVDACVFFASIMRKIGLKPVIFVEPCHAYLGYYTDSKRRTLRLLETTITSWVDFPALTKNYNETIASDPEAKGPNSISETMNKRYNKYLTTDERKRWENGRMTFDEYKKAIAHNIFLKSTEQNRENYNNNKKLFADPNNQLYQQLDIEQLRKLVQPING